MSSFNSNENIHKKEDGTYYVVSANKASSVKIFFLFCHDWEPKHWPLNTGCLLNRGATRLDKFYCTSYEQSTLRLSYVIP